MISIEIAVVFQVIIALGIVNVWILRYRQPTSWRPAGARDMGEEFRYYGLPDWLRPIVGGGKLVLAALLVAGLWIPGVTLPAAAFMSLLMMGAIGAHVRVRDPLWKSVPALTLLLMSLYVVVSSVA